MKKIYLSLLLLCLGFASWAQTAASYSFTPLSIPFVSIAATGTLTPTVSDDDITETGIPLGFPFTYCGVSYNSVSACSNGWLSLSMTPGTYTDEWENLDLFIDDGGGTGAGWLMPYWDDLDGFFGSAYYSTTGTAPNRVFTYEWNSWGSVVGFGSITFQVKLYETTNVIDFCYGTPNDLIFSDATIGIANDQISDWQTLSDESSAPVASTTFTDFIFAAPADGQVYRWTPPVTTCTIAPITGTFSLCAGDVNTLSDVTTGGTWSSSTPAVGTVGATTGKVTGITAGTTVISYATSPTCFSTVVVTVNAATPITGTPAVCQGSSTVLSSGPPGGTWSVGLSSIATVSPSGTVNGILGGTTNVSYTTLDGCFTTVVVSVNPLPAPISGASGMCVGTTTTLSNTTASGTWSSGSPLIATVDAATGVVTAVALGTAVITYTLPSGCYATTIVTVNTSVAPITGNNIVCVGTTTALNSTTTGGTWSSSNTNATVGLSSGLVTGASAGTSTITYSLGGGCFTTRVVSINPSPAAISGVTVFCPGLSATFTHAITGGTWSSSNPAVASAGLSSGLITAGIAGTATITYTLPASDGSCTVTLGVTVNPNPNPITGTLSVCQGSTTTLSSTTTGMFWTSSNPAVASIGTSSGIVTGNAAGTVTITGASGGCSVTAIVTVNPLPANITGTTVFCAGSTTTLGNTTTGGTWSSNNPPIAFVATPSSGVITGATGGTAVISYILSTGCYKTATVTVNALPNTIGGITPLCVGTTATLTNSTPSGTWSSSNTTIAAIGSSTGIVTAGAPGGTATISYTSTLTGCSRTATIVINPLPAAITGPSSLCPTTSVTLSSTSTGGTWSSLNTAVATVVASTGVVTGVATGTATIRYTLGTGCSTSLVVNVTAAPPAIITPLGDTALCPGGFVALTASTSSSVTYEWYESGTFIPGALTSTYIANTAGSYQVKVSLAGGCSIMSVPMSVSVVPSTATITLPAGSSSGCTGAGVLMEGDAGTGLNYQWVSAATGPIPGATAATYTASTSGNYSVIISNSTGCSATSPAQSVTINTTPSALVTLSGSLAICDGSQVTMSVAPGMTYQWYNMSGSISGATNSSYTASTAESYWVQITSSAGCTATSAISNVVVNPLPNVSITHAGSTVFCTGGSVNLGAALGYSYQWYKGGVALAGATNANYVASSGGGYKVRVTDPVTGCSDITHADTVVTLVSSPTVVPLTPARFCWGGSSLLSTSVSGAGGAVMYQWAFNGAAIAGANSSTYNATEAGDYSCTINVPSSCVVTTTTIHVYENPLPDPLVSFDGTQFHTGNFYVSYQWYKNLAMIPGAVTSATPATGNGSYKVAVTDTNGCQSVSTFYVLTGWSGPAAGLEDVKQLDVKIYPNPANATVHIESTAPVTAVITSMDGRALRTADNAKDIDISTLANGVYMIMVYDTDHTLIKTEKLVKAGE